jgi:hypothetical protein
MSQAQLPAKIPYQNHRKFLNDWLNELLTTLTITDIPPSEYPQWAAMLGDHYPQLAAMFSADAPTWAARLGDLFCQFVYWLDSVPEEQRIFGVEGAYTIWAKSPVFGSAIAALLAKEKPTAKKRRPGVPSPKMGRR